MKRMREVFPLIVEYDNMVSAAYRACRGKRGKNEVRDFFNNFDENIQALRYSLIEGTLDFRNYRQFVIYEPKARIISASPIRHRIIQHAIMNICHDHFDRRLIDSCYASRKGRGQYACLDDVRKSAPHYQYYAKLDVRQYFASIDHRVLKSMLAKMYKDERLLLLFYSIIDSYSTEDEKGLPIGNLTSQYFANAYLEKADRIVKEECGIPVYMRYMDDMLLMGNDRGQLLSAVCRLERYASGELKLRIKPPLISSIKSGIVFLGYRINGRSIDLNSKSKRRYRRRLRELSASFAGGDIGEREYGDRLNAVAAFARYSGNVRFRRECNRICVI